MFADLDGALSGLLSAVGAATVLGVATLVWRTWRSISRMTAHVLPHFVPPTATEVRDGAPDNTLPARMARMEQRLSTHLDDESRAAIQLESTLTMGGMRMTSLEHGQARLEAKLDDTLGELKAGNPEMRGS